MELCPGLAHITARARVIETVVSCTYVGTCGVNASIFIAAIPIRDY